MKSGTIESLIREAHHFGVITDEQFLEKLNVLEELERLAKIGEATEFAMQDGSKHTVFSNDIKYLLAFYERES